MNRQDDSVTALAVDWVTSNLYWSSIEKPGLRVTTRREGHTAVLLQASTMVTRLRSDSSSSQMIEMKVTQVYPPPSSPQGLTSIALHPPSGWLCYAAVRVGGKNQAEVSCSWMDGGGKAVVWRKGSLPGSLSFSSEGKTIYWADTGEPPAALRPLRPPLAVDSLCPAPPQVRV